jgi:hypothetical protein
MTPTALTAKIAPPLAPADVDRLADEIAEVASHIDAAEHRLLTLIRRFDESSGWATHGALSCAHWLNWRIGIDLGAARERVRVARALGGLPLVDDALRRGAISYSKVRAVTRVATASTEATLLEMAAHATASQLERICRGYRRVLADAQADRSESLAEEEQRRFVRVRDTDDGMVRIEARLRPDEAAVVLQALDVARQRAWWPDAERGTESTWVTPTSESTPQRAAARHDAAADVSAETPPEPRKHQSHAQNQSRHPHEHQPPPTLSRADALLAVAEAYLSSAASADATHDTAAAPIELVVHVDHAALRADPHAHPGAARADTDTHVDYDPTAAHATLADGTPLSLATAQRLACDATVVLVTGDDGARDAHPHAHDEDKLPSRRTRRIAPRLRRALRLRDDGCRFPGCTNRLTDAHHVLAWARGGATRLANLCSLCRRHHRLVHEHGYRIDTTRDGELRFFRRDGSPVPLADERHRSNGNGHGGDTGTGSSPSDPLAALRDANAAHGLAISSTTAFPRWDGEPVDYGLAVQALLT